MNNLIIGKGYWGSKIFKILQNKTGKTPKVFDFLNNSKPDYTDLNDCIEKKWDHVFITTPPKSHYTYAKAFLEQGNDVWVEKPLCFKYEEAKELKRIANKNNCKLFVDETFLFDSQIDCLKFCLENYDFNNNISYFSERSAFGKWQTCGVMWDLLPHDLSIIAKLFDIDCLYDFFEYTTPTFKEKTGELFLNIEHSKKHEFTILNSWNRPTKTRKICVGDFENKKFIQLENNFIHYQDLHKNESHDIGKIPFQNLISPLDKAINCFITNDFYTHKSYALDTVRIIENLYKNKKSLCY